MPTYTVIVDYKDGQGSTYMTSLNADDPQEAGDAARRECAEEYLLTSSTDGINPEDHGVETVQEAIDQQAHEYGIIAVIEGEHNDLYPHNE